LMLILETYSTHSIELIKYTDQIEYIDLF